MLSRDEVKESERVGVGFFCIFVFFLSFTAVVAFVFFVTIVVKDVEEGGEDGSESVFALFARGFFAVADDGGSSLKDENISNESLPSVEVDVDEGEDEDVSDLGFRPRFAGTFSFVCLSSLPLSPSFDLMSSNMSDVSILCKSLEPSIDFVICLALVVLFFCVCWVKSNTDVASPSESVADKVWLCVCDPSLCVWLCVSKSDDASSDMICCGGK